MSIVVTGGAGFIGSHLVRLLVNETDDHIHVIDKLTYAGSRQNIADVLETDRVTLHEIDICDAPAINQVLGLHKPHGIFHLAAESHVDRSIAGPAQFVQTNVVGTFTLLEAARGYYATLAGNLRNDFRFVHISTDEVYGSLGFDDPSFTEATPYMPRSPYSASKASSDHLVQAWHQTYGLPAIVTHSSNNYGPNQYPEKLIPVVIRNALRGDSIPIYGTGENVRDWLYVEDHVRALLTVFQRGQIGETYNIGGEHELSNINLVREICRQLDTCKPRPDGQSYDAQITFVPDRPGHDLRYSLENTKVCSELGWQPTTSFSSGLKKTIAAMSNSSPVADSGGDHARGATLGEGNANQH